jgi:hypothetical protein
VGGASTEFPKIDPTRELRLICLSPTFRGPIYAGSILLAQIFMA